MNHIETLAQILTNNVGNKLTVELANGIVLSFNHAYNELTSKQEESSADETKPDS